METFDVAVVGGGIAGVSIAYELAQDLSVVLLEKEDQLAFHTTGRSAAAYIPTYGNDTVCGITRASRADFDRLQSELATPALLSPRQVLWLSAEDSPEGRALLAAGGEVVDPDAALALCPVLRRDRLAGAAVTDAMDIDVMALHGGYVDGLRRRGGRILRSAGVTGVEPRDGRWTVRYGAVTLVADTVINAAGAWADVVAQYAGAAPVGLRPLRRTICTTPAEGRDIAAWPLAVDVFERFYFKPEGAAQLLISPADETPVEPGDDRYDDLDVARAIEAVNEMTTLDVRRVSSIWVGLRTFAPDRSPVVGESDTAPGFFWFAGQGGYGIQMAPALARAGAAVVRGRPLPADLTAEGVTAAALSPARFTA